MEELQEVAEDVHEDARCCDDHGIEIDPGMPLEESVDEDDELCDIIPRDRRE